MTRQPAHAADHLATLVKLYVSFAYTVEEVLHTGDATSHDSAPAIGAATVAKTTVQVSKPPTGRFIWHRLMAWRNALTGQPPQLIPAGPQLRQHCPLQPCNHLDYNSMDTGMLHWQRAKCNHWRSAAPVWYHTTRPMPQPLSMLLRP
jgi:hypothetical protein